MRKRCCGRKDFYIALPPPRGSRLTAVKDRAIIVRDNFANLKKIIDENNFWSGKRDPDGLGLVVSTIRREGRGFSFQTDELARHAV